MITRFAPSPTGRLHLGHAWSAVLGHDRARAGAGRWLLRHEDIDTARCRPEHVAGVEEDLRWLGLAWDGPAERQSARRARHDAALETLKALRLAYPCFCTRADIAAAASAPHGATPLYPGTCRALDPARAAARAAREPHAWRLNSAAAAIGAGPLTWHDALAGEQAARPEINGDTVLARRDIGVGYMLAVVADDAADGVTHIARGRDLFNATHTQRLLQALLGLPTPRYLHHPLLLAADNRRLAKRDSAATLASLREAGADGRAVADRLRAEPLAGPDRHLPLDKLLPLAT